VNSVINAPTKSVGSEMAVYSLRVKRAAFDRAILMEHPGEPVLKEYSMDAAVPILPGDIIKVPQRYF
jgi:hypothetical protein